mmetsp:Transcript_37944/g.95291  ORF Transcript_37944/g.95291 Transcript_37944/m.95291 type:complete len:263 (+) Transcript_37944:1539-2327(+)
MWRHWAANQEQGIETRCLCRWPGLRGREQLGGQGLRPAAVPRAGLRQRRVGALGAVDRVLEVLPRRLPLAQPPGRNGGQSLRRPRGRPIDGGRELQRRRRLHGGHRLRVQRVVRLDGVQRQVRGHKEEAAQPRHASQGSRSVRRRWPARVARGGSGLRGARQRHRGVRERPEGPVLLQRVGRLGAVLRLLRRRADGSHARGRDPGIRHLRPQAGRLQVQLLAGRGQLGVGLVGGQEGLVLRERGRGVQRGRGQGLQLPRRRG